MATSSSLRSPCERPPARVRAWASSRKSASTSVASCHTGRSASASDSSRRVLPWREKMASATLSSALSWSKRLTSWNDRAIPARIRSLTGCFVTSWPRKRMWPSSAVSSPLIRLTSVVLPAPLEPMRASTSPSCTRKSTRSTARNSPNCFTRAFVSSSTLIDRRGGPRYGPPASSSEGGYAPLGLPRPALGRAPAQPWRASGSTQNVSSEPLPPRHQPLGPADDAGEQREHEHHENDAEEKLPVHRLADGVALEIVVDDGADDRAHEGAEPTQHGHEDDLAGEGPVQDVGRGEAVERHPQRAGDAGEHAGEHEGHPAIAPDRDADELRARLVVADGLQRAAERRVHDHPHDGYADEEDAEHIVVVLVDQERGLVALARHHAEQGRRRHAQAVGAAGHPEELEGQAPQHLRQRHGEDAEEDARVEHAGVTEDSGEEHGGRDGAEQVQLHGDDAEVLHHQRDRVGADAEVRGVSEREQPGVAQQQAEPDGRARHHQAVGEQDRLVLLGHPRQDQQYRQNRRRIPQPPYRRAGRDDDRGHSAHARPNSPAGRTSRTAAAIR